MANINDEINVNIFILSVLFIKCTLLNSHIHSYRHTINKHLWWKINIYLHNNHSKIRPNTKFYLFDVAWKAAYPKNHIRFKKNIFFLLLLCLLIYVFSPISFKTLLNNRQHQTKYFLKSGLKVVSTALTVLALYDQKRLFTIIHYITFISLTFFIFCLEIFPT